MISTCRSDEIQLAFANFVLRSCCKWCRWVLHSARHSLGAVMQPAGPAVRVDGRLGNLDPGGEGIPDSVLRRTDQVGTRKPTAGLLHLSSPRRLYCPALCGLLAAVWRRTSKCYAAKCYLRAFLWLTHQPVCLTSLWTRGREQGSAASCIAGLGPSLRLHASGLMLTARCSALDAPVVGNIPSVDARGYWHGGGTVVADRTEISNRILMNCPNVLASA